jgi:diadenosine tetraphosphate (Ap4A) HIT family hydrolase
VTHPDLEAFVTKFQTRALEVLVTDHWCWSVRPAQPTLGCGVLSLTRYAAQFSDLGAEEMADLHRAVGAIESATAAAFGYDKINYLMLMMKDPHVHFHVVPRYADARAFMGLQFGDAGWPGVPDLTAEPTPEPVLHAIRDRLRSHL